MARFSAIKINQQDIQLDNGPSMYLIPICIFMLLPLIICL